MDITPEIWAKLSLMAWDARKNARILGDTRVGAAIYHTNGFTSGCNVEHKFRSHDIHAEVNAVGNMITAGGKEILAILVVAEREKFTPCGACMDWIFEFGTANTLVGFQRSMGDSIRMYRADELMPHYPI